MEHEIDEMYDTYEREYGIYFTDALYITDCHSHYIEVIAAGVSPIDALAEVRSMIIGAADEAQYRMDHGYEGE